MTIAEIHGKLRVKSPGGVSERLEDLLTSDVFGTMKYVGYQTGFIDWLRSVTSPIDNTMAKDLLPVDSEIHQVHFDFWPTLQNRRKPDLVIGFETKRNEIVMVMIEAKYRSGPSDFEVDEKRQTIDQSGNQIADQVNNFPVRFQKCKELPIVKRVHLYITAHFTCPTNIYNEAITHIEAHDVVLFWLNWQSLIDYLQPHSITDRGKEEMIRDLVCLMRKKRLVLFRGFIQSPPSIIEDWAGQGFWSRKNMMWWKEQPPKLTNNLHFWRE